MQLRLAGGQLFATSLGLYNNKKISGDDGRQPLELRSFGWTFYAAWAVVSETRQLHRPLWKQGPPEPPRIPHSFYCALGFHGERSPGEILERTATLKFIIKAELSIPRYSIEADQMPCDNQERRTNLGIGVT